MTTPLPVLSVGPLEGSPSVLALFDSNPFPDAPPVRVRARLYDYRFSTPAERAASGAWWVRREVGVYFPAVGRAVARVEKSLPD